ncbi:MAG TPA: VWA domain-containing protein [Thermoanaerobaculia bacterium]|jgi:VWFA-related protein|nr:VWA domain-containing protein [Thermoanaerobaculia bacterium]
MRLRLFAVAVMCATSAVAQMRETVNVNVVEVPVSVADSSGNAVRGLTAANFEVYDNGKKQTITAFDMVDFGLKETASAVAPLNPSARRSFLLLFDLGFSSPRSLVRAQEAARSFVTTAVHPRDLVGVGTIDVDHSFRLLTAFTTDHDLVAAAISDPHGFRGKDPLQIGNRTFVSDLISTDSVGMQDAQDASPGAPQKSDAAKQMDAEARETQQRMTASNEEYVRDRVEKQIDYLADLAKTLHAVPGRKQIVLLSEGFDAKYVQGRDARETKADQRDFASVAKGEVWNVDTNERFGTTSSQSILDRMARAFRSSDVVLNAIDIQGVRVQNQNAAGAGGSSISPNSNEGLFAVSRPTGGEVFRNTNDLKSNFDRMLHAQEVTYVLSFQGSVSSPGKLHDLKVKLVDSPGRVSYRMGYYENGGESATERSLSTAEVVINDIPQSGVRVAAFAAPFPVAHGNSQVPVILELNGADLAKQVRGNAAGAEIYVYAFDAEGIVRDRLYQRVKLDMQKIGDRLRASGLRYYGTLVLPPGTYAIKSLVLAGEPDAKRTSDADRRGYARTDVVVPQAGDVALLPPIPIDEQSKWVLVKGTDRGATGDYPFELSGQIFIPSATASNKVAVVVYGAAANELTWETTPKTKLLGTIPAMGATKFILQVDDPAPSPSLKVTMHMKGVAEPQTTSVALVRP